MFFEQYIFHPMYKIAPPPHFIGILWVARRGHFSITPHWNHGILFTTLVRREGCQSSWQKDMTGELPLFRESLMRRHTFHSTKCSDVIALTCLSVCLFLKSVQYHLSVDNSGYYPKNAFSLNSFSAYFIRADKPISSCIYNNELNRLSHVIMELYTFRPPFGYMSFLAFHYANDILYTMTMRWWWYKGEAQSLSADMTKRERTKRELYTACDITCASIFSSIRKESVGWGFFALLSQKNQFAFQGGRRGYLVAYFEIGSYSIHLEWFSQKET